MKWPEIRIFSSPDSEQKALRNRQKAIKAFQKRAKISDGQIQNSIRQDIIEASIYHSGIEELFENIASDIWKQGEITRFGGVWHQVNPHSKPYWVGGMRLQADPVKMFNVRHGSDLVIAAPYLVPATVINAEVWIANTNSEPRLVLNGIYPELGTLQKQEALSDQIKKQGLRKAMLSYVPKVRRQYIGSVGLATVDAKKLVSAKLDKFTRERTDKNNLPKDLQSWSEGLFAELDREMPNINQENPIEIMDLIPWEARLRGKSKLRVGLLRLRD